MLLSLFLCLCWIGYANGGDGETAPELELDAPAVVEMIEFENRGRDPTRRMVSWPGYNDKGYKWLPGECRTPSGGEGTYQVHLGLTCTQCESKCDGDDACTGYFCHEYWNRCLIHTGAIQKIAWHGASIGGCYKKIIECDAWRCSCQGLSDEFGVSVGRVVTGGRTEGQTWGWATQEAIQWWHNEACTTSPDYGFIPTWEPSWEPTYEPEPVIEVPLIGTNLAQGKPTLQSSMGWGGVSSRAVDGNTDGNYYRSNTCTSTKHPFGQQWWVVDLGQLADISAVKIWNRQEFPERLDGATILVLGGLEKHPRVEVAKPCATVDSIGAGEGKAFRCEVAARYVFIQAAPGQYLSLCEVQVFGNSPAACHKPWGCDSRSRYQTYQEIDCDGDGILDHVCTSTLGGRSVALSGSPGNCEAWVHDHGSCVTGAVTRSGSSAFTLSGSSESCMNGVFTKSGRKNGAPSFENSHGGTVWYENTEHDWGYKELCGRKGCWTAACGGHHRHFSVSDEKLQDPSVYAPFPSHDVWFPSGMTWSNRAGLASGTVQTVFNDGGRRLEVEAGSVMKRLAAAEGENESADVRA